jgi:DNA-binding beta-propeller fold protein YncE
MGGARRRAAAVTALLGVAILVTACGHALGSAGARSTAAAQRYVPQRVIRAPRGLLAAAPPQADGTMWALAGQRTMGLFRYEARTGRSAGSISVSAAARSLAETPTGVLGLALGTRRFGALDLLQGRTGKLIRSVPLPAPARQVTAATSGSRLYVLTARSGAASVAAVDTSTGRLRGSVPVPADTVSIAADPTQQLIYALEPSGLVSEIATTSGTITSRFRVGTDGEALALSPDGGTLYVLKGTAAVANIAVVNLSTQSVHQVLPAPSHTLGLLAAPGGGQLYEVVGTSGYGNIQVVAL